MGKKSNNTMRRYSVVKRPSDYQRSISKAKAVFESHDVDKSDSLDLCQLSTCLSEELNADIPVELVKKVCEEFDKDSSDSIDLSEFILMSKYLEDELAIDREMDAEILLENVITKARTDVCDFSKDVTLKLYPYRNLLCMQDAAAPPSEELRDVNILDEDFKPAFSPCNMRCLALVSHNGMKATMKEFVISNKNILKKFRLTGTNSTMTMLKEVFADEPAMVYGPSCQSGPLGGDAELVALMCSGNLGGMLFFQDPMTAHPHQADIDCLVRQALVHNTMVASTPTTAMMMMQVFRMALKGTGKPELMPSFFFTLQSPAVEAYKNQQKKVVSSHS